ncbi:MAG: rhodanese-like domain-containing protein [Marinosulfonomonas sp.]|nr:rhodanese-like domain-containing protein [Marinosulfonomonas sp.]
MKTAEQLIDEANARVERITPTEANEMRGQDGVLFVDLRDIRELWRSGTIAGAMSAPRGMLEFWIDPECQYYRKDFDGVTRIVLFCASAWRSALAARDLQDMGVENVCHLEGGYTAWVDQGLETSPVKNPYLEKSG